MARVFDEMGEPALLILRGATVGRASCVDKDSKCRVNSFSIFDASSGFGGWHGGIITALASFRGNFQDTHFFRSEFPEEELEPEDMLCGLPAPLPLINPEENPRKPPAGADSRFFAFDELRNGLVVSPVLPSCLSTPSHPFSSLSPPADFGGDLTKPRIDEVVFDRL